MAGEVISHLFMTTDLNTMPERLYLDNLLVTFDTGNNPTLQIQAVSIVSRPPRLYNTQLNTSLITSRVTPRNPSNDFQKQLLSISKTHLNKIEVYQVFAMEGVWVGKFDNFYYQTMKNFRSSKNLKAVDPSSKEESQLRMKIRVLEEQIETLQKSNLNIFIPLSEHEGRSTPNYDAIISKLKTQILSLQQEVQRQKTALKKAESEREMMRIGLQNEIAKQGERIVELEEERQRMSGEIEQLQARLESEQSRRKEKEREAIELRVENKFMKEDMAAVKKRLQMMEKKHEELQSAVMAVNFSSRIYRSRETKITAIETQELTTLKSYIEDLEKKIKEMLAAGKQERITLGIRRENIGEEIVRLKKNIDLQLGLPGSEQTTKSFLSAYHQANNRVNELLTECRQ